MKRSGSGQREGWKHLRRGHLRLIANFCGLPPLDRAPMPRTVRPLGAVVEQLVGSSIGRHSRLQMLADLWPTVVEGPLHRHCRPHGIRGSILEIFAASDAAAQEFKLLKESIVGRIRNLPGLGNIRSIRFAFGENLTAPSRS